MNDVEPAVDRYKARQISDGKSVWYRERSNSIDGPRSRAYSNGAQYVLAPKKSCGLAEDSPYRQVLIVVSPNFRNASAHPATCV